MCHPPASASKLPLLETCTTMSVYSHICIPNFTIYLWNLSIFSNENPTVLVSNATVSVGYTHLFKVSSRGCVHGGRTGESLLASCFDAFRNWMLFLTVEAHRPSAHDGNFPCFAQRCPLRLLLPLVGSITEVSFSSLFLLLTMITYLLCNFHHSTCHQRTTSS